MEFFDNGNKCFIEAEYKFIPNSCIDYVPNEETRALMRTGEWYCYDMYLRGDHTAICVFVMMERKG